MIYMYFNKPMSYLGHNSSNTPFLSLSLTLWLWSSTCELLVFLFAFVVQLYITADLVYRRPVESHKQNVEHTPNDSPQVGPKDRYPEVAIITMSIKNADKENYSLFCMIIQCCWQVFNLKLMTIVQQINIQKTVLFFIKMKTCTMKMISEYNVK